MSAKSQLPMNINLRKKLLIASPLSKSQPMSLAAATLEMQMDPVRNAANAFIVFLNGEMPANEVDLRDVLIVFRKLSTL